MTFFLSLTKGKYFFMNIHIVKKRDGKILLNLKLDLQVLKPIILLVKTLSNDKVNLTRLIDEAKSKPNVKGVSKRAEVIAGDTGKGKREGLFFYITK